MSYRIAVNLEITSKCNARCAMCPQDTIEKPQLMTPEVFEKSLRRIEEGRVFRVVLAGYGEPTTHPLFPQFVSAIGKHPVRFDLVSNGQMLDAARLEHLDGKLTLLLVSFSSVDPDVYARVHRNLDHRRVMHNIGVARCTLERTVFGISLTPMPECLDTLEETIAWLRAQGVDLLTMSPTLYNRAGSVREHAASTRRLRRLIARHGLHSQELDFIASIHESVSQIRRNRFRCAPRNADLLIAANGDYLYCFNDASHRHVIGNVRDTSIADALARRESMPAIDELCRRCNVRGRYGAVEVARVAARHLADRARLALAG